MQIGGAVRAPGDKSITHRLLMLTALAPGRSRLRRSLTALDPRSTARVLRQLGAEISPLTAGGVIEVRGVVRFRQPRHTLHCGNAGTAARLLTGLLAGHSLTARLTGDASLRRRPMARVTEPLAAMGAHFEPPHADRLPLTITGDELHEITWDLPSASAQLKSAILLAGLAGGVPVTVREHRGRSRDHTERLLRFFGYSVASDDASVSFRPDGCLRAVDLVVPGDPSSAAFLVGAALLAAGGALTITDVGLNPTRTGFLRVLERMNADVVETWQGEVAGEPVGSIVARPGALGAVEVEAYEIPSLIDEIPLLAVLAARAEGESVFHEVGELRVKESDRLALIAANLRAVGVEAAAEGNRLHVCGTSRPPRGRVVTQGDHRIAMAFAVLGTVRGSRIDIDDLACAEISFPGFERTLARLGVGLL